MLQNSASYWPGLAALQGAAGAAGAKEGPLRYEFVLAAHPLKEGSKTGTSPLSISAMLLAAALCEQL